ncbi:hypothetical protein N665_1505s0014 [Sinapis alba]|nr:hypothetical protein N665_1505s0014 [Sinapis alba]
MDRFLTPKPPSSLGFVIVPHATFAECLPSTVPFHRKELHIEFIFAMQLLGKVKVEHQKLLIPATTVVSRTDQEVIFPLICCRRGSQLARVSFLVHKGTPR